MMKKISVLLLALVMLFSLAACSGNEDASPSASTSEAATSSEAESPDDSPSESEAPSTAGGDLTADVFIYNFADTYIASVRNNMETAFEAAGITANFHDAAEDQAKQTEQVTTAITQGTDLLIVNIVTTGSDDAAQNIVDLASDADLPIIFFNREISDDVVSSYEKCAFVGTDADEAGVMQGELAYNVLSENFEEYDLNGDGNISYIMFKGELGNAEADGRTKYSVENANELLEADGLGTLVYYDPDNTELFQGCNWDSAQAQEAMATALNTNPFTGENPIELVLANNDDMALGAIEALNEIEYNTGEGDSIPVMGVDATDAAMSAIDSGKMTGTIKQDAEGMANTVVELAQNVQAGNELLDGITDTDLITVDSDVSKIRVAYGIVS